MMNLPINRRAFLAAATGALMAAPRLARSDEAPPVRVAVAGTGARGSDLIRNLADMREAKLVAICDDYGPHLKQAARMAGDETARFEDYGEMLATARPDAVVIAVPPHLHHPFAIQALDAGIHVYCENVLARTLEEGRDLAARVKASGRVFQVGLQRRANPIYEQVQAMVSSGMIGRIAAVKCQWHQHTSWRRALPVEAADPRFDALDRRLNWRLYRDTSHGLFAEFASHQMDVVNRTLGTTPKRVLATGGIDYWRDGREIEDNIFCTYDYELRDGEDKPYAVRVTCSAILNNAWEGVSEMFMGDKGSLLITQNQCLYYREAVKTPEPETPKEESAADMVTRGATANGGIDLWTHRGVPTEFAIEGDDTWGALKSFLEHVQAEDPATVCSAGTGLENLATILMAEEAMRLGRVVAYPLSNGPA